MTVNCQTLVEHNISLVKTASKLCPIYTRHRTRVNKTQISVTKPYVIEQEDGKKREEKWPRAHALVSRSHFFLHYVFVSCPTN